MLLEALTISLGLSTHIGFDEKYNSVHPHLRYTHENFITGTYYNSLENLSVYAGARQEYNNFGIETAIVTGYNNLITPYVRGTYDLGKTRIFIAPGIETKDIGIVLGIEIMLK
jgi:regulatory protein YycH of two-component signal transduction system YycFG